MHLNKAILYVSNCIQSNPVLGCTIHSIFFFLPSIESKEEKKVDAPEMQSKPGVTPNT